LGHQLRPFRIESPSQTVEQGTKLRRRTAQLSMPDFAGTTVSTIEMWFGFAVSLGLGGMQAQ
jgi:hypothetical protein